MKSPKMYLSCVLVAGTISWLAVTPAAAGQRAEQIQQQVEAALEDRDFRRVEISVSGSEVTLSGTIPHLFAKNDAIERTLQVEGVETVASELQFPAEEEDTDIAEEVGKAISRYAYFTLWDYVQGRVNGGVVTLQGSVTSVRDKKRELYETIAKIRGVQDYVDQIEVQSPAVGDERLRQAIGRRLASNQHFERTVTMRSPPYHIVVDRSSVTLLGYVQNRIEYQEMEQIIRSTQGVIQVDNQLQILR